MEGSTVGDMFDFLSKEIIRLQVKTYKNGKCERLIEIPSSTESFPLVGRGERDVWQNVSKLHHVSKIHGFITVSST